MDRWLLLLLVGVATVNLVGGQSEVINCAVVYQSPSFSGPAQTFDVGGGDTKNYDFSGYFGSVIVSKDCDFTLKSGQSEIRLSEGVYSNSDLMAREGFNTRPETILVTHKRNQDEQNKVTCAVGSSTNHSVFEIHMLNGGSYTSTSVSLANEIGDHINTLVVLNGCEVVVEANDEEHYLEEGTYKDFRNVNKISARHFSDISEWCLLFGAANHMNTFSGIPYDFSGKGEFWAVKSQELDVQVRLEDRVCSTIEGISCIRAIAISYGGNVVEIEYNGSDDLTILNNGDQVAVSDFISISSELQIYVNSVQILDILGVHLKAYIFNIGELTIDFNAQGPVVRVSVLPSVLPVNGLCGHRQNGDVQTFVGKHGQAFDETAIFDFGATWQIDSERESLFTKPNFSQFVFPDWVPAEPESGEFADECAGFDGFGWIFDSCVSDYGFGLMNEGIYSDIIFEVCLRYCDTRQMLFEIPEQTCARVCNDGVLDLHGDYNAENVPESSLLNSQSESHVFSASGSLGGQYTVQNSVSGLCGEVQRTVLVEIRCAQDVGIDTGANAIQVLPEEYSDEYPELRLNAFQVGGSELLSVSWKVKSIPISVPALRNLFTFSELWDTQLAFEIESIGADTLYDFLFDLLNFQAIIDEKVNEIEIDAVSKDRIFAFQRDYLSTDLFGFVFNLFAYDSDTQECTGLQALQDNIDILFESLVPPIRGSQFPRARFTPSSPGTFVLEVAGTDGCQIVKDEVRVTAVCQECEQIVSIGNIGLPNPVIKMEIGNDTVFRETGNLANSLQWEGNFYSQGFTVLSHMSSSGLEYDWSLEIDVEFLEDLSQASKKKYIFSEVFQEREVANYSDASSETTTTEIVLSSTDNFDAALSYETVLHLSDGGFDSVFNFPPREYHHVGRQYYNKTTTVEVEEQTLQQYISEVKEDTCEFGIERTGTDWEEVQISVKHKTDDASLCEGDYSIRMDSWNRCQKTTDQLDFVVGCGRAPVVFIDCIPSLEFDYSMTQFTTFTIDGSMSFSHQGHDLQYVMEAIGTPKDSDEPVRFGRSRRTTGDDEKELVNLPRSRGIYTFQLSVSDGCLTTTETIDVEAICFDPPKLVLVGYRPSGREEEANKIELNPTVFDGTASLLMNFNAGDSDWDAPVGTLNYVWEMVGTPIDESLAIDLEGSRLSGREERAGEGDGETYRFDFYLGGIWQIHLEASDGCETASLDITVPIECRTTLITDPGEDMTVYLDDEGGRVYLTSSGTVWESDTLGLQDVSFTYEWIFVSWPDSIHSPPALSDGRTLVVDSSEQNIYDPISNPEGRFSLIPDKYQNGNFATHSENPASLPDSTSFAPTVVGEYVLKLVVSDGCSVDATKDTPVGDQKGHLKVNVECTNLHKPTSLVPATHELNRFTPVEMNGNDPHFFPALLGITYLWSIAEAPEASVCFSEDGDDLNSDECESLINSGRTTIASFWPDVPGDWVMSFTLSSSFCGNRTIDSELEILCSTPAVQIEELYITGNTEWYDGKFGLLNLRGTHAPSDLNFETEVDYWWVVVDAPEGSTYVPECTREKPCFNQTVTLEQEIQIKTFSNGTENEIITDTTSTTTQEYFSYVQLSGLSEQSRKEELDTFGACFFPDMLGEYTFELTVLTDCGITKEQISTEISCNAEPVANAGEYQRIIFDGNSAVRISLDGSGSNDPDDLDRITYEWDWALPHDDWSEHVFYNAVLQNVDQPVATFLVSEPGLYELTLTVSDGCSTSTDMVQILAVCDSNEDRPSFAQIQANVQPGEVASSIEVDLSDAFNDTSVCLETSRWEIVDFVM